MIRETTVVETPLARSQRVTRVPKILHVVEATSAGVARYVADLLLRIDTSAFDVSLAYSPARADERFWNDLRSIQARGIRTFEIPMCRNIQPFEDGASLWRLYRLIRQQRFDLVHGHSSKAGFLGRIAAKLANPNIVTVYSPHAIAISAHRAYAHLERFAGLFTSVMLGVSRSERNELAGYRLLPFSKLRYVTAGIDVPSFSHHSVHENFRQRMGVPPGALLIGSAGRIANQKDPITFLIAAAQLRAQGVDAYFAWAGDGELRQEAEELARSLGIADRVQFLGYCPELRPFLASLDVFILTSRYESFGYVTCEAMAMGKPVVATDVSGSNELVLDGKTGYLVQVGDAAGCAAALRRLAEFPFLRQVMGEAGRKRVQEHFDVRRMVRQVEDLYREYTER